MEDILRHLVAIPTVTSNRGANREALDFIESFLGQYNLHIKRLEWNGVESLIATTKPTKTPKVLLAAHLDVVPGSEDMFALREQNGRYLGRGTFDMKFAIANYLWLVKHLQDKLHEYDFGIMINTDEEVGGLDGAARMIEDGYRPQVAVIPDGGDNWAVEVFAKGIWHVTLTAHGKSAHGSRPWEGDSATTKLLAALHEIQALFPQQSPDSSTLNIGTLSGGKAINQIADSASAGLDIRINSKEDEAKLLKSIKAVCKKYAIDLASDGYYPPCINDPENPFLASLADSIHKVIGQPAGTTKSYGATDARFFAAAGIPAAIVRPPGGGHHGPDEWIDKQGFQQIYEIILDYIQKEARQTNASTEATLSATNI